MARALLGRPHMSTVLRCVAAWLSAAALGGAAAFAWFQVQLAPDFSFLEWRISTAGLVVVAAVAGAIAVRPSLFASVRTIPILIVGHLVAALGVQEFLHSRITCVDLTQSIDYLVPTDTGALLLFGPSLVALVAGAVWPLLRNPQRHEIKGHRQSQIG